MSASPELAGIYASRHDACTRRVYWKGRPAQLLAARTRPGRQEEEPYPIEPAFLTRLIAFGCWHRMKYRDE